MVHSQADARAGTERGGDHSGDRSGAQEQYVASGRTDHDGMRPPAVDHDSLRAYNTIVRPSGEEDGAKQARPTQKDSIAALWETLKKEHQVRPDSIMNGADDDGTGSMGLLELVEYYVKNPTRRSLLFVWHTAEEKGLFGSQWYTDHPTVPRDSIVAQINIIRSGGDADDLKGADRAMSRASGRGGSTQPGDLVEEVNTKGNHGLVFDYQHDANGHPQQFYCRSDHYNYARYGIPGVPLTAATTITW
jgi:Zn-dependent M28 family amino/carboxypeptidase